MVITGLVYRIEDGNATIVSDELGIEICVSVDMLKGKYNEGERLSLTIDTNSNDKGV